MLRFVDAIMPLPVIINSLVCLAGTIVGALFAAASIISIANMKVAWRGLLLIAALLLPVMFLVSGVSVWLAYGHVSLPIVISLISLPWLYVGIFVILMLVSFDS